MAEKLESKDVADSKEPMMRKVFEKQALIKLLEKNGIIFREMSWEEIMGLPEKHTSLLRNDLNG